MYVSTWNKQLWDWALQTCKHHKLHWDQLRWASGQRYHSQNDLFHVDVHGVADVHNYFMLMLVDDVQCK